ncbi:MAG: hypothetical protein ACK5O7_00500 [Holosporales bacterium]
MKTIARSLVAMTMLTGSAFGTALLEEKHDLNAKAWVSSALKEVRADIQSVRAEIKEVQKDHHAALQAAGTTPIERVEIDAKLHEILIAENFLHEALAEHRSHEKKLKKFSKHLEQADQKQLSNMMTYLRRHQLMGEDALGGDEVSASWLVQGMKAVETILKHPVATTGLMLSAQIAGAAAWRGPQCSPNEGGKLNRSTITPVEEFTLGGSHNATLIQIFDVRYTEDVSPTFAYQNFCPASVQQPQAIDPVVLSQNKSPVSTIWTHSAIKRGELNYKEAKISFKEGFNENSHGLIFVPNPECGKVPLNISIAGSEPCVAARFETPYLSAGGENRCQVLYHCPVPQNLRLRQVEYGVGPCTEFPATLKRDRSSAHQSQCDETLTLRPAGMNEHGVPLCEATYQCPTKVHRFEIWVDFYAPFINSLPTLVRQARDELTTRIQWMLDRGQ